MIFERIRNRLLFVLQLKTILGFQYQASTQLRLQTFKTRLENESRVGTLIRRNLLYFVLLYHMFNQNYYYFAAKYQFYGKGLECFIFYKLTFMDEINFESLKHSNLNQFMWL